MKLWTAFFGPRLYTKYGERREETKIEMIGNNLLAIGKGFWRTVIGIWPLALSVQLWRGSITVQNFQFWIYWTVVGAVVGFAARFFGRKIDEQYKKFAVIFEKAQTGDSQSLAELKSYDYDMGAANLYDFQAAEKQLWYYAAPPHPANPLVKLISWLAVKSFGLGAMFPGSFQLLFAFAQDQILESRSKLITERNGKRSVLKTAAGDLIDTIYLDARKSGQHYGQKLVICCEGNGTFYEFGMMTVPMEKGHSVIGWNYPGFIHSTGSPMPKNVLAAADAVMQYATGPLGWKEEDIVIYSWSIGGFAASWLAANYKKVRALILDATFDNVLHLAAIRMPGILAPVVECAIKEHLNLDVESNLREFKGPVRIYRRLRDDMMCTLFEGSEEDILASNRTNYLLKAIMQSRHADKIRSHPDAIDNWLAMSPSSRKRAYDQAPKEIRDIYFLCEYYFVDIPGQHIGPLPVSSFDFPAPMLM
ncbi:unnamed protein product, partial [Mesorhabditis spiculigera]